MPTQWSFITEEDLTILSRHQESMRGNTQRQVSIINKWINGCIISCHEVKDESINGVSFDQFVNKRIKKYLIILLENENSKIKSHYKIQLHKKCSVSMKT